MDHKITHLPKNCIKISLRDAIASFEAEPFSVQQCWDDFYLADKNRLPSSGIGYATLYIYCKKRGYDTYFQEWTTLINGTWNLGEGHLPHFFESADSYLYYRTWQKLNDAFHQEYPISNVPTYGCISGVVYIDRTPVSDAEIQVIQDNELVKEVVSIQDGVYDIPLLKAGTYTLIFSHPQAIAPVTVEGVVVTELQSTNQDGYLEP